MKQGMQRLIEYCEHEKLVCRGEGVVLGVSGGADSVCLLLLMLELAKKYQLRLCVAHVHHGLRGEAADADAEFVRQLCVQHALPFRSVKYDIAGIAASAHLTVEEAGRTMRYRFFREVMQEEGCQKLAVAHHQNDQAETVLFHLVRGTGLRGLCGMQPCTDDVIRPLLCVGRREIEEILQAYRQPYCTDATNQDSSYARNRIRNQVMGELEQINAGAVSHIASLAQRATQAQAYIEDITSHLYAEIANPVYDGSGRQTGVVLALAAFLEQHVYMQQELVRKALKEIRQSMKDIGQVHVQAVVRLAAAQTGKYLVLPDGLVVHKTADTLYVAMETVDAKRQPVEITLSLSRLRTQGELTVPLPEGGTLRAEFSVGEPDRIDKKLYTKQLDCDKMKGNPVLRYPQEGDYLQIDAQGHQKTLAKYMKDEKIPRYERQKQLVLADGHHVIWLVGYRMSAYYHVCEETREVLTVTWIG